MRHFNKALFRKWWQFSTETNKMKCNIMLQKLSFFMNRELLINLTTLNLWLFACNVKIKLSEQQTASGLFIAAED